MYNRFIVSLSNSTKESEEAFATFLNEKKLPFWHWLPNTWLIITNTDVTIEQIGTFVATHFPEHFYLIHLLRGHERWLGYGPNDQAGNKDMFKWLNDAWSKL